MVERARIILACLEGKEILEQAPPKGLSHWDGPTVAATLGASVHAVWRVLRREGIYLQRLRTWCVSTDPEFAPKAADVIGLYLNPPLNALVLSVDEKPSIQAIQRPSGYVETDSGAVVRAMKSTYKRNGTLNLFAALEIASGQVHAQTTEQKKREDFRRFLDAIIADLPTDKEIHVILDNYCTHKHNDDWLAKYDGRVQFHFTPTSASWLNQIEIWFGLLTRKSLRGASFANKDQLRLAIEAFVARTNENPKPFHWRKREVKGKPTSQYDYKLMQLSTSPMWDKPAEKPAAAKIGCPTLRQAANLPTNSWIVIQICRPYPTNFSKREPGRTMVWLRSGPVEMQPTSTPVRASRKAMYCLAFAGSSS